MGESCWLEAWDPEDVRSGTVPAEELVRSGPDQVGRDVASELGLGGRVVVLAGACAAGNYALGHALDLVRLGRADAVLAGGTDAFSRVAFTGFARLGALADRGVPAVQRRPRRTRARRGSCDARGRVGDGGRRPRGGAAC